MIKYLGPKNKISRKFNYYIYNKIIKKNKKLGYIRKRKYFNRTQYYYQLLEKQKIKYIYGLSEKQLKNFIFNKKFKKRNLLINCELRLDNILYRLGYFNSRKQSRQYINHKHILLNNKNFNIPSYQMKINDEIILKKKYINNMNIIDNMKKKKIIYNWGVYNNDYTKIILINLPEIKDTLEKVNIKLIKEYYSK
ncbi:MAG: 30S ribosomal protein S4 [Candidatus Shikimatogenerans sp. Tduv]|uniref:Small ribosomal subunit protein uS4 n=1 Tax=Candidatus Shikimatogenerans sp. Tduv TaxID=3158567 RepID=A0AAU7QRI5_9FLAO